MKVLLANKFFFRNGGSEVVMFQERDFLIRSGIEVVDFSMANERNFPSSYSDYFVSEHSYRSGGALSKVALAISLVHSSEAARKFSNLIAETEPDIVHCHNIYHQLTPSIIGVAKSRNIPVVLTLHDYKPVCPTYLRLRNGAPCSLCLSGNYFEVVRNRCADKSLGKSALLYAEAIVQRHWQNYEQVDLFLAPSEFMRESVLRRFPPSQVILLPNGVDTLAIEATSQDAGYVLYIGRLSDEKGIRTLLSAHQEAKEAWRLIVAGTGPHAEALAAANVNVEFVGHLTGPALTEMCKGASVIVVPSEWYENAPMSILEAMAFGKPVVASRIGGIPELVADEETGLLFEPGNTGQLRSCLDRMMADIALRRSMGAAARNRAEDRYSSARHNEALLAIYHSLCSRTVH